MFLIGMFRSWRVYAVVSGAEKAEDEEEETGDNEGIGDGGVDGILLDLYRSNQRLESTDKADQPQHT